MGKLPYLKDGQLAFKLKIGFCQDFFFLLWMKNQFQFWLIFTCGLRLQVIQTYLYDELPSRESNSPIELINIITLQKIYIYSKYFL